MKFLLFLATLLATAFSEDTLPTTDPSRTQSSPPSTLSKPKSRPIAPCKGKNLTPDNKKITINTLEKSPDSDCQFTRRGDKVDVRFVGRLYSNCKVFDTTASDEVVTFTIGDDVNIVEAWHKGLVNMCPGDRRMITTPASFGYGEGKKMSKENALVLDVPSGEALIFEVELVAISAKGPGFLPGDKDEKEKAVSDDDIVDDTGAPHRGFRINSPRGSKQRSANRKRTNHPRAEKGRREERRNLADRERRRRRAMGMDEGEF